MAGWLTETQRRRYEQDGILFPLRILEADEVSRYRTACEELEAELGGRPRTVEVRQMHLHFPWAWQLATHPRLLDAVEDLLGPNLFIWATELFAKHPHDTAVSVGWHQDGPYMGFEGGRTVTAWIALSPSTAANGCMRALPGPERWQTQTVRGRPGAVDEREAVNVELEAGEMSLHDAAILHGSGPNHSDEMRMGFVVRFLTPDARPLCGRPPVILARGHDAHNHCQVVEPPTAADAGRALAAMKESAAQHLEAMLSNLAHSAS